MNHEWMKCTILKADIERILQPTGKACGLCCQCHVTWLELEAVGLWISTDALNCHTIPYFTPDTVSHHEIEFIVF
jgi:hypothetical protein